MQRTFLVAFGVLAAVLAALFTMTTGVHAVTGLSGGIGVTLPVVFIYFVITAKSPLAAES